MAKYSSCWLDRVVVDVWGRELRVLIVDDDSAGGAAWKQRFSSLGVEVDFVHNQQDLDDALQQSRYLLGVHRLSEETLDNSLKVDAEVLNQRCYWSIAVIDSSNASLRKSAYADGFYDCVDDSCESAMFVARLEHAKHLYESDQRLAQAQKLESVGELAAGIAHEINTPIQYVGDNARFVQEACNDINGVLIECQKLIQAIDTETNAKQATEDLRSAMEDADIEYLSLIHI